MNKITLKFSKKSDVELSYFGESVLVNPIIKITEQQQLRAIFIASLFKDGEGSNWDEQFAEFMFRREILNLKTNINIESIGNAEDVDELIWGDFFEKIKQTIVNYYDVRNSLDDTVAHIIKRIAIDNGSGILLKSLVEKATGFITQLSSLQPEDFEKLTNTTGKLLGQIQREPMASIISDKSEIKKPKKNKKG